LAHVQCDWKLAFAMVIASVSLTAFSPMDNVNRRLDVKRKRHIEKWESTKNGR